ncbi:adenine nucleotide alpha hydrolase [Fusarium beomiforme]|uniref:Adenine nucleotide alpha hydrolase n=1 Tax=Fusarium beomiforme TaxID=44412 RepID=A0A9P5DVG2_9HYPO|nr:adenine nucleotide alpha hydrolase [Fusarium beomiforme]
MIDLKPDTGRVKRPRYEERELSEELLKFHIPKCRYKHTDPLHTFYDLYRCYHKGPGGSSTYDSAGFQLDYKKVADWMKPRAYNKKTMVNGMERRLKKGDEERKEIYGTFFVDGKGPQGEEGRTQMMDQIKGQVPKDLRVPWHQNDSKRLKEWEDKEFEKVKADD